MNSTRIVPILALLAAGCADSPSHNSDAYSNHAPPARPAEVPHVEELSELSLPDALRLAAEAHPELAEALALVEAAEGRAEQAGLMPNPEASLRMEVAPFGRGVASDADYLFGVSQAIPLGGRLGDARGAHGLEAVRLAAEARVRERALSKRVRGAWAEALFFENLNVLRDRVVELTEASLKTALARQSAGEASADEVARGRLEVARAGASARAARSSREVALSSLAIAMGRPGLLVRSLRGELEAALEIPALEELMTRLQSHPALAAADADLAARTAFRDLALAERIPDLNLSLGYHYIGSGDIHAFDAGVSFTLPVFDRNQGRIREAEADIAASRARARQARTSLEGQLRQALVRLSASLDALRVARESLVPAIGEVVRIAEARFAAGDASAVEVALAHRERVAADVEVLEALREATEAWGEVKSLVE